MFKAIYNGISYLIFRNPRVSKIKRKEIISYFKNSIEKKFVVINLEHYSSFEFLEQRQVEEKDNNFSLYFLGVNVNTNAEEKILLGTFNNKKDVEIAIKYLQNKYFSLGGAFLKFLFWIVLVFILLSGILGRSPSQSAYPTMEQLQAMQAGNVSGPTPVMTGVPGVNQQRLLTPEQQKAYTDQINAALNQMKPNPNLPGAQQAPDLANTNNQQAAPTPSAPAQPQQPDFTSAFSK